MVGSVLKVNAGGPGSVSRGSCRTRCSCLAVSAVTQREFGSAVLSRVASPCQLSGSTANKLTVATEPGGTGIAYGAVVEVARAKFTDQNVSLIRKHKVPLPRRGANPTKSVVIYTTLGRRRLPSGEDCCRPSMMEIRELVRYWRNWEGLPEAVSSSNARANPQSRSRRRSSGQLAGRSHRHRRHVTKYLAVSSVTP